MCIQPQLWQKKCILELVQSSKHVVDADSDDENENNATPVPTSSEIMNIMKSMRSYVEAHFEEDKEFTRAIRCTDFLNSVGMFLLLSRNPPQTGFVDKCY
ncbi:hypothetical protein TNCV_1676701 [Trichonephila clavipes]|nr:hypothetical protein TNCV_1676701 [Trichonephila clavipes]